MKKVILYTTALLASGLAFTACDSDAEKPVLQPPTDYSLETPAGADKLIIFGTENSNVDNQLKISTKNPFNLVTTVDFQVQVAKSAADFETWDLLVQKAIEEGVTDYNFTDDQGLPYTATASPIFLSPDFTISGADFCSALNTVYGFDLTNYNDEIVPVAYRVHAWVPGVNYSSIFSNPVTLAQVQSYIPITEPGHIYLIGASNNWTFGDTDALTETAIGSGIYKGQFMIPEGKFMFRFYAQLTDGENKWDLYSIGAAADPADSSLDISFTDGKYSGPVFYNPNEEGYAKVNWNIPDWAGGIIDVTVDLNDMTISMETIASREIYLIGAPQDWKVDQGTMPLQETEFGTEIYTGEYEIAADQFQLRFYAVLGDWETNSIGAGEGDQNVVIAFADGVYTGPCFYSTDTEAFKGKNKDNWQIPGWGGGKVKFTVNLKELQVTFEEVK